MHWSFDSLLAALPAIVVAAAIVDLRLWQPRKRGASLAEARVTLEITLIAASTRWLIWPAIQSFHRTCERVAPHFPIQSAVAQAILAFVAIDFTYYWIHRLQHRIPFLWPTHRAHHQTRHFNISAGLRHPVIWSALLLHLPLGLLLLSGLSLQPVSMAFALWIAYGHFTHLSRFPKMSFLENYLVTPTNHRVHHARALSVGDGNFGIALLIWDRLFGTLTRLSANGPLGTSDGTHPASILQALIPWRGKAISSIQSQLWALQDERGLKPLREAVLTASLLSANLAFTVLIWAKAPRISWGLTLVISATFALTLYPLISTSYRARELSSRRLS